MNMIVTRLVWILLDTCAHVSASYGTSLGVASGNLLVMTIVKLGISVFPD